MRSENPIAVYLSTAKPAATVTVANATDIFTSTGHGLVNEDRIVVSNSGGALPAGMSASTIYYVINATTNTFQLSTVMGGAALNVTGDGTGTHTFNLLGKSIFVEDYQHIGVALDTKNSANLTIQFVASFQEDAPNWYAAKSETNQFDVIEVIDLEDGAAVDGDTGIAPAGTDDHRMFELNLNGARWVSAIIPAATYTAGNVAVTIKPFTNQ